MAKCPEDLGSAMQQETTVQQESIYNGMTFSED